MLHKQLWLMGFICICLFGCMTSNQTDQRNRQSFNQLVGESEWDIELLDLGLSLEKGEQVFKLMMRRGRLQFDAHLKADPYSTRFAPLQPHYMDELNQLLDQALFFTEQKKDQQYNLAIIWELYPESIKKWGKLWQSSDLKEKWDSLHPHFRSQKLREKINDFLLVDFKNKVKELGYEPQRAHMEKMSFFKAGQYKFFQAILKPAGLPATLKIPIPMMLSLDLKSDQIASTQNNQTSHSDKAVDIDNLFITATANSITVYATFNRNLNEYELSGTNNNTYESILPMLQPEYRPISNRLLQTMLNATNGYYEKIFSMRIKLHDYPKLYQEVVQQFNGSSKKEKWGLMVRPELPLLTFYDYQPKSLPAFNAFQDEINSFLAMNGYKFQSLQISLKNVSKAATHYNYKSLIKPLGYQADQPLDLPDIVYMIIVKK